LKCLILLSGYYGALSSVMLATKLYTFLRSRLSQQLYHPAFSISRTYPLSSHITRYLLLLKFSLSWNEDTRRAEAV